MRISREDCEKLPSLTEKQIERAQTVINEWRAVQDTMSTRGWEILRDYFEADLAANDSVRNCSEKDFLYRKGVCDGLAKLLQTTQKIKNTATSATKLMEDGLAENKE